MFTRKNSQTDNMVKLLNSNIIERREIAMIENNDKLTINAYKGIIRKVLPQGKTLLYLYLKELEEAHPEHNPLIEQAILEVQEERKCPFCGEISDGRTCALCGNKRMEGW